MTGVARQPGAGPLPAAERSRRIAEVFDEVAECYDNVGVAWFTPIARELVARLAPEAGERALDLGCGRGAATFALADAVGPAGRVTAVDLSRRMVAATTADAAAQGRPQVEVLLMDAGTPSLPPASYDLAVASFVLFFLPAPVAALRAWRRLLVPGGRVGVSTFTRTRGGLLDDLFLPYLPEPAFGGGAGFGSDDVARMVTAAGFGQVRSEHADIEVRFGSVDQWYAWSRSHGQRAIWQLLSEPDRRRVRAEAASWLAGHRHRDGTTRVTERIRFTIGIVPP